MLFNEYERKVMMRYIIRQPEIVVTIEDNSEILLIIKVPGKATN